MTHYKVIPGWGRVPIEKGISRKHFDYHPNKYQKRIHKKYFTFKEVDSITNLIISPDLESQYLGFSYIKNSKTAKHYALSYNEQASEYVNYMLDIILNSNIICDYKDSHLNFIKNRFLNWLSQHIIYSKKDNFYLIQSKLCPKS